MEDTGGDATKQEPEHEWATLFDIEEPWRKEWQGMPEFSQEDARPWKSLTVHFRCQADLDDFFAAIRELQNIIRNKSVWFPNQPDGVFKNRRWKHES